MDTLTEPVTTGETAADMDVMHGAHLECQKDADFVTLACGMVAGWDERNEDSTKPECPLCWSVATHCPVCGVRLSRGWI